MSTVSSSTADPRPPRQVAVVDIGSTSIRMQISQINTDGSIEKVESLSFGVSIGKDTFAVGAISKKTIEECVRVLKLYQEKLREYGITDPREIRVVATSGVRDASNGLAFLDRVYIATGLQIEPFNEAELHRVTYLGIQPFFQAYPEIFSGRTIVCEVGGGTTEALVLEKEDVTYSRSFRLGSIRLRKALDAYDAPVAKTSRLLESQVNHYVHQIFAMGGNKPARYVAMGGEIRFLTNQLHRTFREGQLAEITIQELKEFTEGVLAQSPERLVTRFHINQAEAESLGPALYAHLAIATMFQSETIYVANVNLRDGLIKEIAQGYSWSESVQSQVIRSAERLGEKYQIDSTHATHVAFLGCQIFDQLQDFLQLDSRHKLILHLASLLHEVGQFVNVRSYHKHSMYLIRNSEFFGIDSNDLLLVSLVARYHRRATPQPMHEGYAQLDREQRVLVAKLSAILRIAIALDVTRTLRIQAIQCSVSKNQILIRVNNPSELAIEHAEIEKASQMLEDLFGVQVVLVNTRHE
ncbi:MAG: exopolyphosphatase [Pirellulaceae bacterium]